MSTGMERQEDLVRLGDVSVTYRVSRGLLSTSKAEIVALDGVSLAVKRGRTLGLVGATGSGKSTIAHLVMGMVQQTKGSVVVVGRELREGRSLDRAALRRHVQVVLQDPYSSLDPRMRVGDIVAEPLTLGRLFTRGARKAEIDRRVAELLGLVGLRANRARRYPHEFSGGQRQRIAIARALATGPELIVLDEPTSALDVSIRAQILILLKSLQEQLNVTYLVISHDLVAVAFLAAEVAVMHRGRVVELGPTMSLFHAPRHPYTLELLASAPGASGSFLRQPRPADVSEASLPPSACRYAYRCALRRGLGSPARCLDEDPALTQVGESHLAACHFSEDVVRFADDAAPAATTATASAHP